MVGWHWWARAVKREGLALQTNTPGLAFGPIASRTVPLGVRGRHQRHVRIDRALKIRRGNSRTRIRINHVRACVVLRRPVSGVRASVLAPVELGLS